jgi:ABC-type uncharacterized transport system ATPase subunit
MTKAAQSKDKDCKAMNIRIEKVSKKFGSMWALEEVSLELEPGHGRGGARREWSREDYLC